MASNDSLRGTLDLLVLKVLSRGRPLSGYAIQQAIEMSSKGKLRIRDGSLYPALARMQKAGWITSNNVREGGRSASLWKLSSKGEDQFLEERLSWASFRAAVYGVLRRK
jgi:DNA-binding PadR family transcriptional regulator